MNLGFGLLSLILVLEYALLFLMCQRWGALGVSLIVLIGYVVVQYAWPMVASRLKAVFALLLLLGVLAVLPSELPASLYVLYALFMHFFAWMVGYEGYLGKRPGVRTVNRPRNPRSSAMYTEAFWPTLISAYFSIDQANLHLFPEVGKPLGLLLLVLAGLFWEYGRRLSSADQPVPRRTRERPILRLVFAMVLLLVSVVFVAQPLAKMLPEGVDEVRAWVEQQLAERERKRALETQQATSPPGEESGGTREADGQQGEAGQQIGFNTQPELPLRSKMGNSHTEDVFMRIQDPQARAFVERMQIYLRGTAHAHYVERKWYPRAIIGTWTNDEDDLVADGMVTLVQQPEFSVRHTVFLNRVRDRTLLAMPGMSRIMMDRLYQAADAWYVFPDSSSLKVSYTVDSSYYTYDRVSPRDRRIGQAEAEYYEVPEDAIMPDITNLANAVIRSDAPAADKVVAYRDYLRDNYTYSRQVENPEGYPPLWNFLFEEKKGYCDFYATSLTLMLRSQGIPSRMAVGYAGGTWQQKQELYVFHSDNAHSWTEVFLEDYGWVIIDATPPDLSTPDAVAAGAAPAEPDFSEFEDISEGVEALEETAAFQSPPAWDRFRELRDLLILGLSAGCGVLLVAALVWWLITRRGRFQEEGREEVQRPQLGFYVEIQRLMKRMGVPDEPGYTPMQYKNAVRRRGVDDPAFDEITEYVYAVNYCDVPRELDREKAFVRSVKGLLKAGECE